MDLLGFQHGCTHVTLAFSKASAPLRGQLAVAGSGRGAGSLVRL
jgi:hypothetical protein